MTLNGSDEHDSLLEKVRHTVVGAPRNIKDPSIFHKLSLVPLLAFLHPPMARKRPSAPWASIPTLPFSWPWPLR
jgi:hypothetical protein